MTTLGKFRVFALEMALGALIGAFGLLELVYGVPPLFSDLEMLRKFAASLITIGGTLLTSGLFRFLFSMRLDGSETRILSKLDEVSAHVTATIMRMLPAGVSGRPNDGHMEYRHLYWRTQDSKTRPMWLSFSDLAWKKQILPFLEARTTIKQAEFASHHDYLLAMVELRGCVVVVATRFHSQGSPHNEMSGVYIHAIPIHAGDQLFGCLRHVSMGGHQCLSACILSRTPLDAGNLDRMWLESEGGGRVVKNFPEPAGAVLEPA